MPWGRRSGPVTWERWATCSPRIRGWPRHGWATRRPRGPCCTSPPTGPATSARFTGAHRETPLHWAAGCDDVPVLDTLLDLGADIEADGGVIGDGTPLADAVAFGQWKCARRLLERGARTTLWQAAALGEADRVTACFTSGTGRPAPEDITAALWCACHGGQQPMADYLLRRGGDVNWIGYDRLTALDAADRAGHHTLVGWLREHGAKSAGELV
ncbi:ankyrin repeat domain-containing protein [Streptomyces sp. NPDC093568]|uniref:ankyrin repeat domain-containing protein n=1 Tax=Streptomyces sp. NPDC093568 TaxID=3366041 RepID=UPI0037FEDAC5